MKKLLLAVGAAIALAVAVVVPVSADPYQDQYNAVYCYPNGSYWQAQRAAYPQYYAANNAYFVATYGC